MKDYYKILGVSKNATDEEIRKAYKKLSMKYHPDRPSGNEAKFKEINEAHDILSDPEKRVEYNNSGNQSQYRSNPGQSQSGGPRFHTTTNRQTHNDIPGFNFSQFSSNGNPFRNTSFFRSGTTFENLFETDNDFNGFPFEPTKQKVQEQILKLSFEEMYSGCKTSISYAKTVKVDDGYVNIPESMKLDIPPRCYVGKKLKLTIPDSPKPYSIIIIIQPKEHDFYKLCDSHFKTDVSDLELVMKLSLRDSLIGFKLRIPGIDGNEIVIEEDEIIDPRTPYKLTGKGFIDKQGNRGNLYIKFDIQYPKKLTPKQRQEIKKILS